VAVMTPAIYQAFAARGLAPRLKPHVEPVHLSWRFRAARALLGGNLEALLRPIPVQRVAAEGGTGVPLFGPEDLEVFLSEAEQAPPDRPGRARWWEFWPTDEGTYAMFPADADSRPSITVALWIPIGRSAQVHRLDLSPLLAVGGSESRWEPVVPPEPCVLLAEEVEPGAPYYRGRCSNTGCDGGCTHHVVLHPDDGIYRLRGCDC
jgi:hypothetical protein